MSTVFPFSDFNATPTVTTSSSSLLDDIRRGWAAADTESVIVGSVMTVMSVFGACVNISVMLAIWRARLMSSDDPLYILSTFVIVDPTIRMFYSIFVWSPSDIFKFSVVSKPVADLITMSALACFLQFTVLQIIIAVNRYWLVTKNSRFRFFTRRFCITYSIISIPLAHLIIFGLYPFLGCCRVMYDPYRYLLRFDTPPPGGFDYASNYIFLPAAILGSSIPIFCYGRIFCLTRKRVLDPSVRTFEFSLIFVFYILFFIGVKFNTVLPPGTPRWANALVMVVGVIDAMSISLIQVMMNKRIRRSVRNLIVRPSSILRSEPLDQPGGGGGSNGDFFKTGKSESISATGHHHHQVALSS